MQHLQPNTTLQGGKYRIERVLGQGGFGITYLATQLSLQRQVAIKEFFMKDFCSRDESTRTMSAPSTGSSKLVEQYRKKFIKEARNLARLNHPHIISVIDVFEENGTVYYVMPYLIGGSLQDYVKTHGTLSEQEAMKYVKQIAGALKYMHEELHICHYDVKPANILLDNKGNAVLIDFGISKNYDASGQETTTTPVGMSEGYAPIEQYQQNVEEFSPVIDVYALGATLYFLLHGKRPVSAIHRASGTELAISEQISPEINKLITATMKISKKERAKDVDVFFNDNPALEHGATTNDRSKGCIYALFISSVLVALLFFIINIAGGSKEEPRKIHAAGISWNSPLGSCRYSGYIDTWDAFNPHGTGEVHFNDGRYYRGGFCHGVFTGKNTLYRYPNGDSFEGEFRNNAFYYGVYRLKEDNSYYCGPFVKDERNPQEGAWYDENGKKLKKERKSLVNIKGIEVKGYKRSQN